MMAVFQRVEAALVRRVLAVTRLGSALWRRLLPFVQRASVASRRVLARVDAFQQRHAWLSFPFAVVRKMSNDGGSHLAGLIAYYGFLGVFPLLLVFAAVLGFVLAGEPALRAEVLRTAESSFPALQGYVSQTISGNNVALGVGLVVALWAGLGVTRATERAMNAIWDIPLAERPNLWWSRIRGAAMLCILGATFLVSTALASLRGTGGALALPTDVLAVGGSLVLNVVLYLLAFQVLTNRHLRWRQIWPGALVGAIGWTTLQNVGAFYVRHEVAHASQLYGSLGVVVGLLAWIYLGAQLTLYAAEVNVVLSYRLWPRSLSRSVHTDADRRALTRQAREAERTTGQAITVSFETTPTEPHAHPTEPVPATEPAGPAGPIPPSALATHHAVALLTAHLAEFDNCRQQAATCEDPAAHDNLLNQLRAEAKEIAGGLARLARQEPDLGETLTRYLS